MKSQAKRKNMICFVKDKKPRVFTNVLSKLFLMHLGKKDGKKGIPSNKNNPDWMSPALRKEYAKIDEKMAEYWYVIDEQCGPLYAETEELLAKLYQSKLEIEQLHEYIVNEGIAFKEVIGNTVSDVNLDKMIKEKRKNEQKCDDLGIRLRRYKEYSNLILNAKKQYFQKKALFKNDYQNIKKNYQLISTLESEIDIFFWELRANIERRTAWYWQGVLLKHPQRDSMPQIPPSAKNDHINEIYENRRATLIDRLEEIERYNEKVLSLTYVE